MGAVTAAIITVAVLGLTAAGLGIALAMAKASAASQAARAAAAELQNTDLADQLLRADAEKVSLRARIDEVIKQRDKYRLEAINANPAGAGAALNDLGGMPNVSDGTAENRGRDEVETVPNKAPTGVGGIPRGRPGNE